MWRRRARSTRPPPRRSGDRAADVNTENALCILLGRNPGHIERGKSVADMTVPETPAQLPSQLLERRPDIAQAEQQLVAANAQIGAAKALYFPTISLTGALGSVSGDLSSLFTGPTRVWSYGGSLLGPIFTGGAVTGQVRQAEGAQQAALFNYEKTVQGAFADVENALIAQQKSRARLQAQQAWWMRSAITRGWPDCSTTAAMCRTRRSCRRSSSCFRRS